MPSDYIVRLGLCQLQLLKGDITKIAADAIVNAANSQLAGGGGVDGAIHSAGGPEIMRELDGIREKTGECRTGSAVVTSAGRLPAKFVLHAVGPVYRGGTEGEAEFLRSCYATCLQLASERDVKTISFPSISTGVYRYPVAEAASVALTTVAAWLEEHPQPIHTIKLVQFSDGDHAIYKAQAERLRAARAHGS